MEGLGMGNKLTLLASVAGAALVLAPEVRASGSESRCENLKLDATADYVQCLTKALKRDNESAAANCDANFDKDFERADRFGCSTPVEGAAAFGARIKQQVEENAASVTGESGGNLVINDNGTVTVTVDEWETSTAFDFDEILTGLSDQGVTKDTTIVIQAWGGDGGSGNAKNGGSGGTGGYAQTITTIGDYENDFGTTILYYYIGYYGAHASNTGGDGGTATVATPIDLTNAKPDLDQIVLLAAGGGGGGGGSEKDFDVVEGGDGGQGAVAISNETERVIRGGGGGGEASCDIGMQGGGGGTSDGKGGSKGDTGNPTGGADDFAPIGGAGGSHNDPQIGFVNQKAGIDTTAGGGRGGEPGSHAGGGGGGGGYGAGGGGAEGTADGTGCSGGGGGGASAAMQGTRTCAVAPTGRPSNPNQSFGFVQFIVDLGGCE